MNSGTVTGPVVFSALAKPKARAAGLPQIFFFHDVLKAGEVTTLPQYMTGVLSLAVFAICAQSLLKSSR